MKRFSLFFVCMLVVALAVPAGLSLAQDGLPALPPGSDDSVVLFPDVIQDMLLEPGVTQQQFVLLADAGDVLVITVQMSQAGLVSEVQLTDANSAVLTEQTPASASPSIITLSFEAAAAGWYRLVVVAGTGSGPYTVALTGTGPDVFDLFGVGQPPLVAKAHLLASAGRLAGNLETEPASYLIPLALGDVLSLSAQGTSAPRLRFTLYEGSEAVQALVIEAPQAGSPASYNFVSDKAQWAKVDVEPTQAGSFVLDTTLPKASGMVKDLMAPAGGVTVTTTTTTTGELCGGIPARFQVGENIVVSPEGDNLQLLKDYTGGSAQTLELAGTGDLLEVIDPPVCYSSPGYGQDIWFWYVFSHADNLNGWVADGLVDQRWLCPEDNPNCNQVAVCTSTPAAFAVGDVVVVSEKGDNLQIVRYAGALDQVIDLAVWRDELEVLGGPVCFDSEFHETGVWYWNVFSRADNLAGWVVQGNADEIWLCPQSNPTCDQ
ncbi:MAG: hypothetical protein HY866_20485 [Chloroflexi bacterium]|nr:hypothetical protein [Chloroflexota bacterium]